MNTSTVVLSKIEYKNLKLQSSAYQKIMAIFFELTAKNQLSQVVKNFQDTKLYSNEFIKDLEDGLKKSSYFKHYGNKTIKGRSKKVS